MRQLAIWLLLCSVVCGQDYWPVSIDTTGGDVKAEGANPTSGPTNWFKIPSLEKDNTFTGDNTFNEPVVVPYATDTNHAVPLDQVKGMLEAFSVTTLYGSTNLHPTLTDFYSLEDVAPADETPIVSALAEGTNYIGMFLWTNTVDFVRRGNYIGRFYASKDAATTVEGRIDLVMISNDGSTTNVLATSSDVPFSTQAQNDYRIYANVATNNECTDCWLGCRYYLIRTGNPAVNVTTIVGGENNAHLETPGLDYPQGLVPYSALAAYATNAASGTSLLAMSNNTWVVFSATGISTGYVDAVLAGKEVGAWHFYSGGGLYGTLTNNGTWYDLSLTNILPVGARSAELFLYASDSASINFALHVRPNGATNVYFQRRAAMSVAGVSAYEYCTIGVDSNGVIEYMGDNGLDASIIQVLSWGY